MDLRSPLALIAATLLFAFALAGCLSGPEECFRSVECVRSCGGPVIQSGCAACPSGSFDRRVCAASGDASTDASTDASSDATPSDGR